MEAWVPHARQFLVDQLVADIPHDLYEQCLLKLKRQLDQLWRPPRNHAMSLVGLGNLVCNFAVRPHKLVAVSLDNVFLSNVTRPNKVGR